ncbi:MAG: hypothetical protein HQM08_00955 [Candidatus Riflebacteria bacterium]|nr:hypothetical protein [Candidatus Riflebacteria bacterium]
MSLSRKRNLTFLIACTMILGFSLSNLEAANALQSAENKIGTVDFRTCLALHPLMATFDFAADRFSRPNVMRNDQKTVEGIYERMAQKKKTLEAAINGIKRNISALQLERNTINLKTAEAEIFNLQIKNKTIPDEENVPELNRVTPSQVPVQSEKQITDRIQQIDEKILELEKSINSIQDSVWTEVFLSREETDKKLQQIVAEVNAAIKQIADQNQISTVIDDSLNSHPILPEIMEGIPLNTSIWANSIYQLILNSPLPQPGTVSIANHWAGELQKSIEQMTYKYLATSKDLSSLIGNYKPPRMFLFGGVDLTIPVCEQIFTRYHLNPYLIQSLKTAIAAFRR